MPLSSDAAISRTDGVSEALVIVSIHLYGSSPLELAGPYCALTRPSGNPWRCTMLSPLTTHARVRMQQRGIPEAALDVLLEHGREAHDHHGAVIVLFDKRSRKALRRRIGDSFRKVERWLDSYAVVGDDGAVITVGHRDRRV